MDLYQILDINTDATKEEIRQAYKKLILIYHPDKSQDPQTKSKFQEIQTAYEILYDDVKRKEYDRMTIEQKNQIYDLIKQYFTELKPEHAYIYDSVIDLLYENDEETFKTDVNTFNGLNILNRIANKIKNVIERRKIIINIDTTTATTVTAEYNMTLLLKERYNEPYKIIKIPTSNNECNEYSIPTYEKSVTITDPEKGKIIINIITQNNDFYSIVNEHDLVHIKNISLSQYIYGGKVKIYDVNGYAITYEFGSCLDKKPVFILKNKGLPKFSQQNQIMTRGDLFLCFHIEGINSINKDDISQKYNNIVKETIKLMFPPIE